MHPAFMPFDPAHAVPFRRYAHLLADLALDLTKAVSAVQLVLFRALCSFAFGALDLLEYLLISGHGLWVLGRLRPAIIFV